MATTNYYGPRYMGEFLSKEFIESQNLSFRQLSGKEIESICKIFTLKRNGSWLGLTIASLIGLIVFGVFVVMPILSGAYVFAGFSSIFLLFIAYAIFSTIKTTKTMRKKLENREGKIACCIAYAPQERRERRSQLPRC